MTLESLGDLLELLVDLRLVLGKIGDFLGCANAGDDVFTLALVR